MIEGQLPSNWRQLAAEHGLCAKSAPEQLGAKVQDVSIPLRLVFHHVGTNTSLKTTTATAAMARVVDLSAVALHKWMRRFPPFLAALLVSMTDAARCFAAEVWAGYDIVVTDATVVTRPGSEGTTARVHYAMRLTNLVPIQVDVTDQRGGETFRRFGDAIVPGQLWMGDRGYANPPGIAAVKEKGAEVLVRYNRGSLPLYDGDAADAAPLDIPAALASLDKPLAVGAWDAWVHPQGKDPIRGRLCAVRLPAEKAEEARVRLRREQGAAVTPESLAMADYVVVFTTVPACRLGTERILELYTLRWQVELKIKRDKSIGGLDRLPNYRDDTIRSWVLAKLILVQVARKLTAPEVNIPPCAA